MISELTGVMTAANRMFQPSFSGEQHGNHDADVALNTAVKVILDRRSEDYE
jgi:hypothetical protein